MPTFQTIIDIVKNHYPEVQAIYLFGSYGTEHQRPDSDVDIALLLPPERAKKVGHLLLSELDLALQQALHRDIDLINLRLAPTVLRKEILEADRRLFCADTYAADEFEMLTLSFYQKLNEERADIITEGLRSGFHHL